METIWQDLRYGVRSLRRSAGVISVAILSLGVGIGAITAIFSAVDVFVLRPLPYPESDRIYTVSTTNLERGWTEVDFSVPDFLDLRERSRTMSLAAADGRSFNLSGGDRPERLRGWQVSANFFQLLQVQPAVGRAFAPEEEEPGRNGVVIISDGLWQRRFGADPGIVGSTVLLDSEPYTVIGVMPSGFWFASPGTDLWVPTDFTGEEPRNSHFVDVIARISPEATPELAAQEAQRIAEDLAREYPETNSGNGASLESLHSDIFGREFMMGSMISLVAVAFVLLIACANVANLLLTHAAGRYREVAVRGALGAGRTRIVRQFLTEALIVALAGGVLGLILSAVGIRGLLAVMPPWFPRLDEIGLDARVLVFTGGVTMLTAVIVGLAPALQGARANVASALREGGRGGTGVTAARLRKALVVGEVALALVLLVSSALLVQGFARIRLADLGFDKSDVMTFHVTLPESDYPDSASVSAFHTQFAANLATLAGVEGVGGVSIFPLHGNSATLYALPGEDIESDAQRKVTDFRYIFPGYFAAMDIPIVRGRVFDETHRAGTRRVILINQAMAERHWPDADPIGRQIVFHSGPREIIGVVANTMDRGADTRVRPTVYFPTLQGMQRGVGWVVEASVPLATLVEPIRASLHAMDPNLPAHNMITLDAMLAIQLGGDTVMAKIMGGLATIALILALAGVYAVMAYTVSQRRRELGIRLALGAQGRDVRKMVIRQGTSLALVGVVIGVVVGLGVTRSLSIFLYGVSPFDPVTFTAVAATLLIAGLTATYFPARRATKVDPMVALRAE